jgi:hypothetical protein
MLMNYALEQKFSEMILLFLHIILVEEAVPYNIVNIFVPIPQPQAQEPIVTS